jgi:hypothetical protein
MEAIVPVSSNGEVANNSLILSLNGLGEGFSSRRSIHLHRF